MNWDKKERVLIVGLGLIGGSYARALSRQGYQICALDTRGETIRQALFDGTIVEGYTDLEAAESCIRATRNVIFGLTPSAFVQWIERHGALFAPGTTITDVCGVKATVVYRAQEALPEGVEFIPSHPMAGREKGGYEHSTEAIFRGANFLITPTQKNTDAAVAWCRELAEILGCARVRVLTPEEHDEMIGFVSQLTHMIAVSLMTCTDNAHLAEYTGDSFRDLTRIARINDQMWSELFLMNKDALLHWADCFIEEISGVREMLRRGDQEGLKEKMRLSTQRRAQFDLDRSEKQ